MPTKTVGTGTKSLACGYQNQNCIATPKCRQNVQTYPERFIFCFFIVEIFIIFVFISSVIGVVLGVGDLWVHPWALVVGVIDLSGFPFGFGGVGVGDVLGFLPVLGLNIFRIVDLSGINPVIGFLLVGILESI